MTSKCSTCGHSKSVHGGKRTHAGMACMACMECEKFTPSVDDMKQCKFCSKWYVDLERHLKRTHGGKEQTTLKEKQGCGINIRHTTDYICGVNGRLCPSCSSPKGDGNSSGVMSKLDEASGDNQSPQEKSSLTNSVSLNIPEDTQTPTLSDKIYIPNRKSYPMLDIEDVKTFIKKLKEEVDLVSVQGISKTKIKNETIKRIDTLAGGKLI